jgi:molybdopterin/thiamine biosynthesis adenylyltransferase
MMQCMALPNLTEFTDFPAGGRFIRQEMVEGWSQEQLANSRVLVVGAGALGNEALKNLAMLGIGTVGVIDCDRVEESNLSRCGLFGVQDIGRPKALAAADRLQALSPGTRAVPFVSNLQHGIGAGLLEEFDLVLGCVDNVAARWRLNRLSRRAGVRWIDAGIDSFCGQVAYFDPAKGACYECGMTDSMWQRMLERTSCLLPAPDPSPAVATTVVLASLTAALQVQEAVATLLEAGQHLPWSRLAAGERLSIRVTPYELFVLKTRVYEECMAHAEENSAAVSMSLWLASTTVDSLLLRCDASSLLLEWEIVDSLECPLCGIEEAAIPSWKLREKMLLCASCGRQRRAHWIHAISHDSGLAQRSLAAIGVPPKAHLKMQQRGSGKFVWYRVDEPSC